MTNGGVAPSKVQPALLGGVFMGVLSALPFVSYVNACCCLWVVVGGVLAAWLLQQNYPYAITTSDGAVVGLLAGVFGALIGVVITALMAPFQRQLDLYVLSRITEAMSGEVPPVVEQVIEQRRSMPAVTGLAFIASLVFSLIVNPIFAMLGGLLGAVLFKKGGEPPPPPSPIDQLYPPLSDHPPVP